MKNVLGGIENDEVDYLFKQLDSDGDDIISKDEFIEYLIKNWLSTLGFTDIPPIYRAL